MASTVYFPEAHTPEEWRKMSQDRYQAEQESWERSDTDGYLSQWALSTMARLYSFMADVAEQGGVWEFEVLADAEGNEIEGAKEYQTRYGYSWRVPTPNGVVWFNPSKAQDEDRRKAANLKKGFQFIKVRKPAVVVLSNNLLPSPYCVPRRDN